MSSEVAEETKVDSTECLSPAAKAAAFLRDKKAREDEEAAIRKAEDDKVKAEQDKLDAAKKALEDAKDKASDAGISLPRLEDVQAKIATIQSNLTAKLEHINESGRLEKQSIADKYAQMAKDEKKLVDTRLKKERQTAKQVHRTALQNWSKVLVLLKADPIVFDDESDVDVEVPSDIVPSETPIQETPIQETSGSTEEVPFTEGTVGD